MKLRVILVDDESLARDRIRELLESISAREAQVLRMPVAIPAMITVAGWPKPATAAPANTSGRSSGPIKNVPRGSRWKPNSAP